MIDAFGILPLISSTCLWSHDCASYTGYICFSFSN